MKNNNFYIDMVSGELGVILNYEEDYSAGIKVATLIKEPNQITIVLNDNVDSDMACDIYDFVSMKFPAYYAPDEIFMESQEEVFGDDLDYPAGVKKLGGIVLDIPSFDKPENVLVSSDVDDFEDEDFSRGGEDLTVDNMTFGLDNLVAEDTPEVNFTESCNCNWFLVQDIYPQNEDVIYFVDIEGNLGIGIYNEDMHAVAMADGLGVILEDIKQWAYADYKEVAGYPCDGETVAIEMPDINAPALAMYTDNYITEKGERYKAAILSPIYEFEGQEGDVVIDWSLVTTWYRVPEIKSLRALDLPEPEADLKAGEGFILTPDFVRNIGHKAAEGTLTDEDFSYERTFPVSEEGFEQESEFLDSQLPVEEESKSAIVNSKLSSK